LGIVKVSSLNQLNNLFQLGRFLVGYRLDNHQPTLSYMVILVRS
jgi:hypothetical protein